MLAKRFFSIVVIVVVGFAVGCTMVVPPVAERTELPDSFVLPVGFRPEGIAINADGTIFVGSLGTIASEGEPLIGGAIYRGDLTTGEGAILVEPAVGQMAVGLKLDTRSNYLFVAGGMFGDIRVYKATNGEELARYAVGGEGGFINDLIVTDNALYATDSFFPVLYRIPLSPEGQLVANATGETITLSGDYMAGDGTYPFQANGIVATPDGAALIIVNSNSGLLYRVDPRTGMATVIELGDKNVAFGDGLVLDGTTLYVAENYANQIAVVTLAPDLGSGTLTQLITAPAYAFNIPTTAALYGDALYVVNARFEDATPLTAGTPDIDYAVMRVTKPALE